MIEFISSRLNCDECKSKAACVMGVENVDGFEELSAIVISKRPLAKGTHLYQQGDSGRSLFLVKAGSFRSFMVTQDGIEQTIGFFLPGDLIGLDALETGAYSCGVQALETSTVCELPLADLLRICVKSGNLQQHLLKLIGKQITINYNRIALLAQRSAMEKTANFLFMVSKQYGARGYSKTVLKLTMPRRDIASFLGLTIETLSRQFAMLNKMHIINIEQRWVEITNMEALKSLVESEPYRECS